MTESAEWEAVKAFTAKHKRVLIPVGLVVLVIVGAMIGASN